MKESFFSIDLLVAIAAVLSIALVGYNAFLMPDYAPASVTYPVPMEAVSEPVQAEIQPSEAFTVNLNTADTQELQRVPGIGPSIAGKILEYRERVGVITDVRELLEIKGIGDATLEKLAPYFVLEG